jgi:hypothetical protein
MLILRAKDPVCEWRGLHLALSDGWREHLRNQLSLLVSGKVDRLKYRSSLPDGRAWFNLYTSGVDFGSWWDITFEITSQAAATAMWVRYVHSAVCVRLSPQAASTLAAELEQSLDGGVKSSLSLSREVRPSSEPQALWLWRWLEKQSAG